MNIWHLGIIGGEWDPWYDTAEGFVVIADSEDEARALADANGGNENEKRRPWLDPSLTFCHELTADGVARVVLRDFHDA